MKTAAKRRRAEVSRLAGEQWRSRHYKLVPVLFYKNTGNKGHRISTRHLGRTHEGCTNMVARSLVVILNVHGVGIAATLPCVHCGTRAPHTRWSAQLRVHLKCTHGRQCLLCERMQQLRGAHYWKSKNKLGRTIQLLRVYKF